MNLVVCPFIDGASATGALFVIFFTSQVMGHADIMKQNHARLSLKLKSKSHLSQPATRCKSGAVVWLAMIYAAKSMDGQVTVLNQVAELARTATQAATAATAIVSQFSSHGSSSMERVQ